MEEKRYLDYLNKLIKKENYDITKLSIDVEIFASDVIEEIEIIKRCNEDQTRDIITYHSSVRIQEKLQKLFNAYHMLNFKKENIRNYRDEIFKINGSFNGN